MNSLVLDNSLEACRFLIPLLQEDLSSELSLFQGHDD